MSARLLCTSPTKLTIWFLRNYVWSNAYTDALVCVARHLNIVDRAMIYEAIIGTPWNLARTYCESVRLQGYETVTKWLRLRVDKIESAPVDIKYGLRDVLLSFSSDGRALRWIVKCACAGNLEPIVTLHECYNEFNMEYQPFRPYKDLSRMCNECGLVDAILTMHNLDMIRPNTIEFTLHPKTYVILRELRYQVRYDTRGILECIDAGIWIQDDMIQTFDHHEEARKLCKYAIEMGLALDWVHKYMTIHEMASVEVEYYERNETIQWFIDHKVDHYMFWFDAFSIKNVMFALPRLHDDIRGIMLARSEDARMVYKINPFTYNRDVFMQLASYKVTKKITKHERRFG
jgi:hypothetical protein